MILALLFCFLTHIVKADEWYPTTSGPFFTDGADVLDKNKFVYEPWVFQYNSSSGGMTEIENTFQYGLGGNWELDAATNTILGDGSSVKGKIKHQFFEEPDSFNLWGLPSISASISIASPGAGSSVSQFKEKLILRKKFYPFIVYGDIGVNESSEVALISDLTFEHVLYDPLNVGYLWEFTQTNSQSFSFLQGGPELEVTYPNKWPLKVSWGVGVMFPISESNYPSYIAPMATITFTFK